MSEQVVYYDEFGNIFTGPSPEQVAAWGVERQQKAVEYGWKLNYGMTTSTDQANKKRQEATIKADDWFFATMARSSPEGQQLLAMRAHFDKCRKDFGWQESYGKLTSTDASIKKRQAAEDKALTYTCEKFQRSPSQVGPWLLMR